MGATHKMATQIKLRRDTAANWTSTNPILALGEPGLEIDTRKIKYGDGTTAWTSLAYSAGDANFSGNYTDLSNKPTIPAAQIQSDWTQTDNTLKDFIKNKPSIPAAQIQSDWTQTDNTLKDFIKNKPTLVTNLDSLSDVTITSATSGQVLKYNGTAWVNDTDSTGGGASTGNITFSDTTMASTNGNVKIGFSPPANPAVEFTFATSGNLVLPQGTILSETANSTTITPPNALAGQSLVVRLTGSQGISSDHPGGFTDGDTITLTIVPDYNLAPVTGTVDYTFTGCTSIQLGRALTGTLTFTSDPSKPISWTIPVSSTMTTFTITLSNASGFSIAGLSPLTLTSTGSSEDHHIHLIAGDPSITDIYLGDDDQYVKIEKNGGNVVIGTDTNSKQWIFGTDGGLTLPGDFYIGSGEGALAMLSPYSVVILADQGNTDQAWLFDTDGNLTLPHGGVISEIPDTVTLSGTQTDGSMNATYTRSKYNNNYYVLGGSNWSIVYASGTYRLRYATDSSNYMYSSDLITWTLGPAFSGDIETPSTGAPTIGSTKITSNDKTWSFGTGGNLTLPTNTSNINYANGTSILSGLGAGGGIALTDLSIGTDGTPTGGGNVSYNNTTGVFTYTPPVIPDVSGFALSTDIPDVSGFVTGTPWTSAGYLTTITNIFDQDLNTANNVTFSSVITSNVQATNGSPAVASPVAVGGAGAPLTISAGDGGIAATGVNAGAGGNLTITAGDAGSDIGNPSWGEIGGTLVLRGGNSSRPYHGSDVQIHSGNAVASPGAISLYTGTNQWTFGKDGTTTLANNATIISPLNGLTVRVTGQYNVCTLLTGGSGYGGGGSSSAVSGGSGTGMIVGYGYGLSGQVSNVGVTDPGTGYSEGDVLTMTAGNGGATFVITKYNTAANAGNNNTAPTDWIFGTTNNLTLPLGGDIKDSTGNSVLSDLIALTDLSIGTDGTPTGGGSISYANSTGVFTYTPPVIPDVSGFALTSAILAEPAFTIKTTDFNATAGSRYGYNTTAGVVTATLPASPAAGDAIYFADASGTASTNNFIIARNSQTIMGSASNMTVNVNDQSFGLFYNGTTWRVY